MWPDLKHPGNCQEFRSDYAHRAGCFRKCLRRRFGTVARWRKLTGRSDTEVDTIVPLTGTGKDLLYWEWWRFQREAFGRFLRAGHAAIRKVDAKTPLTYALLCGGRWDAATEDADLPFLDHVGQTEQLGACDPVLRNKPPGINVDRSYDPPK